MARAFLQYWKESTAKATLKVYEGEPVDYSATPEFGTRGVEAGDILYIVSMQEGQLVLLSRGTVEAIVDTETARIRLDSDSAWDSPEHAFLQDGLPLRTRFVPDAIAKQLRFTTQKKNHTSLKFRENGRLDGQTMRTIRRLTPTSAAMLDEFLGSAVTSTYSTLDGWDVHRELNSVRESVVPFDPKSLEDGRSRIMKAIVQRQGQGSFRQALLSAYGGRCCVTGCTVEQVLEAAHIMPYKGAETNHVQNGLLLRADIHTLFDLDMLGIEDYRVTVSEALIGTEYERLEGKYLLLPASQDDWPNREALCLQHVRVS